MNTKWLTVCLVIAIMAVLILGASAAGAQRGDADDPKAGEIIVDDPAEDVVNPNEAEAGSIPIAEPRRDEELAEPLAAMGTVGSSY